MAEGLYIQINGLGFSFDKALVTATLKGDLRYKVLAEPDNLDEKHRYVNLKDFKEWIKGISVPPDELQKLKSIFKEAGASFDIAEPSQSDFLTPTQAKELLGGISDSTLYRLAAQGKIKVSKPNRRVLYYSRSSIINYISQSA